MNNQEIISDAKNEIKAIRKVQAYTGEKSLTIVLPRTFTHDLGIQKGDYLQVEKRGKQLIVQKAFTEETK
jgi:hypothetical protein